jgi:hypothetical protein
MCRNQTRRLGQPRRLSFCSSSLISVETLIADLHIWPLLITEQTPVRTRRPRLEGGTVRRDGLQAADRSAAPFAEDATMYKFDDSAVREYDEYIASALRTEGGHLSIGRGGFTL